MPLEKPQSRSRLKLTVAAVQAISERWLETAAGKFTGVCLGAERTIMEIHVRSVRRGLHKLGGTVAAPV